MAIRANWRKHVVEWDMDPETARDLANFINDHTHYKDLARQDAQYLMECADRLDGIVDEFGD